jgi:hypothetical protein
MSSPLAISHSRSGSFDANTLPGEVESYTKGQRRANRGGCSGSPSLEHIELAIPARLRLRSGALTTTGKMVRVHVRLPPCILQKWL